MKNRFIASLLLLPFFAQASSSTNPVSVNLNHPLNARGLARPVSDPLRASALPDFVPGEVLVKYKSGTSSISKSNSLNAKGSVRIESLAGGRIDHVRLAANVKVAEALVSYAQDSDVESVQPNYIYHLLSVPNDPQFSQQWALNNISQSVTGADYTTNNPGVTGDDMGMTKAWDYRTDCSSTVVAVVDTGINYNHEDLASNMWSGGTNYPNHGYNFVGNTNDPMDYNGHGTHVSGIIGAAGNNGKGISGVCWKASLMAVRVLDATGSGSTSSVVSGLQFAATNGAKVINMSLGMAGSDPALQVEINALAAQNIVVVVAAGNDGNDNDGASATYPCSYKTANLICVAALDQSFALASFSNYGATSVHVGSPGTNILSSFAGTSTTTAASFQTGGTLNWTTSGGGWAYGSRTFTTSSGANTTLDLLLNPSTWDAKSAMYASNLDARAYKTFNIAGANTAVLTAYGFYDIGVGDSLNLAYRKAGGDPFAGGTALASITTSTGTSSGSLSYDISACNAATCTVGFQLKSDATAQGFGAAFYYFGIEALTLNTTSYQILDGTSMATPQVAGLAAMIYSQNPNYVAADVIRSIKNGGTSVSSLASKTTTGKAVNGFGSLSYIAQPTGVTATAN